MNRVAPFLTSDRRLYTSENSRVLDRRLIADFGIPGYELMCRAGATAFRTLISRWAGLARIAVVCGPGNNGGDGLVVARLAAEQGFKPVVFLTAPGEDYKNEAAQAFADLKNRSIPIKTFSVESLVTFDLIVDGIFGTGLAREVSGVAATAIAAINATGKPVLALDIPSGLSADTGRVLGQAIRADATVAFISVKRGLYTADGPDFAGEITFDNLNVPAKAYDELPYNELLDWRDEVQKLPRRPRNSHKGLYGHVLVIGGDEGMSGAAQLAGTAALRSGAGLVTLATRKVHAPLLNLTRPELLCHAAENYKDVQSALTDKTVVALGPGLGRAEWGRDLIQTVLQTTLPLVVDADGLNLLAQQPLAKSNWILTPHPKEAARLLNVTAADVQNDRFAAASALQKRYGGVTVLKGCGTVVCDEGGLIAVCPDGNPGMASGGMGDVLTGVIAGLLAQGLTPANAARLGVCAHARAGDVAAGEAPRGLLATDLLDEIRKVLNLS